MANLIHSNLTSPEAIHPAAYVASSDPGSVGANKLWIDTTNDLIKRRNTGNTAWITIGTASSSSFTSVSATGLTGATSASRYVGATTGGSPTSGTFLLGDFVVDQLGKMWVCITAGTPGTWRAVGSNANVFLAQNFI